ncbi:MAG TPA: metallopeptidase TldD-related protein [Acidimicrobiales bacterium]|nr:metallopeptidase TldD-related protein [Acidimicrobiales bacterium]
MTETLVQAEAGQPRRSGHAGQPPGELCEAVLERVGGRAEAEVAVSRGRSALTRFANSHIHQNVSEDHVNVRLRLVAGGRLASASTNRADAEGIDRLVEGALEAARLRPVDHGWPGLAPPAPAVDADRYDAATRWADPRERAQVVADFVAAAPGLAGAGYCASGGGNLAFANTADQRLEGRTSAATLDAIHRTPTADGMGWQAGTRLGELDGGRAGEIAAAKARTGSEPVDLEPGRYEVVLEPACVDDMLFFLLDGFSAKTHAEGRSFLRLGEAQFDPAVTLCDDVTHPDTNGLAFDAEGTPKRPLDLVVGGVPSALLHDRRTARQAGTESTGHGVVGGESFGPAALNPVLAPGDRNPEELVASMSRGLLVTDLWYTRVLDPKTSVVTGLTRNGTFLVEGGQVVAAVRNLRFTQSYAEALAPGRVLGVGSDLRLRPSGTLVPSLHLASWNFTGSVTSEAGP